MNLRNVCWIVGWMLSLGVMSAVAAPVEKFHNDKARVTEQTLAPGEALAPAGDRPGIAVFLEAGAIEVAASGGARKEIVRRGQGQFQAPGSPKLKNAGRGPIRVVWIDLLGPGSMETWGIGGLGREVRVQFENEFARVYDLRVATGKALPQTTLKDRIEFVILASDADQAIAGGTTERVKYKAGDTSLQPAVARTTTNTGKTDLWIVAVELK